MSEMSVWGRARELISFEKSLNVENQGFNSMGWPVRSRCAKSLAIPDGERYEMRRQNHDVDGVK